MFKAIYCLVPLFVLIRKVHTIPVVSSNESWPISDKDGNTRWINVEEAPIQTLLQEFETVSSSENVDRIRFMLYTQTHNSSEPVEIDMNNVETLVRSSYDSRLPTAFGIHGWKDVYTGGPAAIRKALFESGRVNYIAVDWKVYSNFKIYAVSQKLCSKTGKTLAKFIDWMHENAKLRFDMLTLYGHSMGSQVAGFAGKYVERGRVQTIIGMDPALPMFPLDDPSRRLAATDAEYVETIHTNGGYWGFFEPIGHISFYPNGGIYQPGCGEDLDRLCSHIRALEFIDEALRAATANNFHAVRCEKLENVETRSCNQYETIIRMGDPENAKKPRGIYYLRTNSESPFAIGMPGAYEKNKQRIKNGI